MQLRSDPHQTLREIESIDRVIMAISQLSADLASMREVCWQQLNKTTKPLMTSIEPPQMVHRGLEYRGDVVSKPYCIDIHLTILKRLWDDFPSKQEDMAKAMAACGVTRCYVSRDRTSLFRTKPKGGVEKHSFEFAEGWYADKCLTTKWMSVVLAAAVRAAGMRWNVDVRVFWGARVR